MRQKAFSFWNCSDLERETSSLKECNSTSARKTLTASATNSTTTSGVTKPPLAKGIRRMSYKLMVKTRGRWECVGFDHATVEEARGFAFRVCLKCDFLIIRVCVSF